MHIDIWFEPLYVSFQHLRLYEGYAPPINRTGWFQNIDEFPDTILAHGQEAGAGSGATNDNVGVAASENRVGEGDFVAMYIGGNPPYYNGSYQVSIPVHWFAKDGLVTNQLPNSVQTIQIFSNGTMRASKNGVTWEQPLGGQGYPVTE